jgi:sugar lactone lactonase YvrE
MSQFSLTQFIKDLRFPEGLRWNDGELWFSDFLQRRVFSADAEGDLRQRAFVPGQPSGLGFSPDGQLLVASMFDRNLIAIRPEAPERLRQVAYVGDVVRGQINDMAVDARGRAYIGNFGYDAMYKGVDPTITTGLAFVDEHRQVRLEGGGLFMPNGIALSPNGKVLIVAETTALQLSAFDIAEDGSLSGQRVFAALPQRPPDGICVDCEGAVWVAYFTAREFVRVREGGAITDSVSIPSGWATACALGGADGRSLYCAVAETDTHAMHLGESKGRIECTRVAVPALISAVR